MHVPMAANQIREQQTSLALRQARESHSREMRPRRAWQKTVLLGVLLLAVAVSAGAQDSPKANQPQAVEGIDSGNYNIRQTIRMRISRVIRCSLDFGLVPPAIFG
jgi:hypothetical protein